MPPELRFGRFVIEGLLGPGGVTETYLAHAPDETADSQGTTKLYAVKLLRQDRVPKASYEEVARRFVAAGRQLAGFHRPGLGRVVEVSDDTAQSFIASEYVAGRDLIRLVESCQNDSSGGIDPGLAGLIGAEVARILHVGHAAKPALYHLGLCPANVMVTEAGEVLLLDAGIAAAVRAMTEQPPERSAFVAPELQGVDTGAVGFDDGRALGGDLFSLGLLLAFLLSGRLPQPESGSGLDVAQAPGTPAKLAAAMRTLLSPEPEDRPESAAILVEWLAEGHGSVRERQTLIAERLRTAEQGRDGALQKAPLVETIRPPPPIRTPGPRLIAADGAVAARTDARKRVRSASRLASAAVCGALAIGVAGVGFWRWQVRTQSTASRLGTEKPDRKGASGNRPGKGKPLPPEVASRNAEEARSTPSPARPAQTALPLPSEGERTIARVAGHLVVETVPPGAMVWVDGVLEGKSFADITVGPGGHRIVLIREGHRMFRDVVDTGPGVIVRRSLPAIDPPTRGDGFVDVRCHTAGKYPILLDDEETGLLCPAKMIPTPAGKHTVGIYVPPETRSLAVEITVEVGSKPALATFTQ